MHKPSCASNWNYIPEYYYDARTMNTKFIFSHYLMNGTIFEKKVLNIKCFHFLYKIFLEGFSI